MIQTLTHQPAASLIAFMSLVDLTFVANRIGLISWFRWLVRNERIVTKKSATAKTQMNIGGYTGETRSPNIEPVLADDFGGGILIDDSCVILRLDVKKRKLPVDLVKLAEIAISPDFALRLYAFVAPPDVDDTCRRS